MQILLVTLNYFKMIATFSVGYDHIDLKECLARNIRVCNCSYGDSVMDVLDGQWLFETILKGLGRNGMVVKL